MTGISRLERDYSIINQTALTLLEMSDTELQTILRNTDNHDIEMAMKELPGMARAHIFENVSVRLGRMIAEDIVKMGKVPLGEVEKACVAIMKKVIKLEADGECERRWKELGGDKAGVGNTGAVC